MVFLAMENSTLWWHIFPLGKNILLALRNIVHTIWIIIWNYIFMKCLKYEIKHLCWSDPTCSRSMYRRSMRGNIIHTPPSLYFKQNLTYFVLVHFLLCLFSLLYELLDKRITNEQKVQICILLFVMYEWTQQHPPWSDCPGQCYSLWRFVASQNVVQQKHREMLENEPHTNLPP